MFADQTMRQIVRFGLVGVSATIVHILGAVMAAYLLSASAHVANLVGFATAVLVSFYGHSRITFKLDNTQAADAPRFVLTSLFGLGTSSVMTYVAHHLLGLAIWMSVFIAACSVPVVTFSLLKFWVFARASETD